MDGETILTTAPTDLRTAAALADQIESRTSLNNAATLRNHMISAGILMGVGGMTIAACIWAYGQRNPSPEAWKEALANMPPVKVETSIDPNSTLKIAPNSEVKVTGNVGIDPNATVKVTGEVLAQTSALEAQIKELQNQPKTQAGKDPIKREVTVFNAVQWNDGSITTGWTYPDGGSKTPSTEFCYYSRQNLDGSSYRVEVGKERLALTDNAHLLPNLSDAFLKCIWYSGSNG